MHAQVEGRLSDAAFQETADDAVRLVTSAQQRAGATVYTDGEQRRDSYASFVATRLDNCQLVPLTDLLPPAWRRDVAATWLPGNGGAALRFRDEHGVLHLFDIRRMVERVRAGQTAEVAG